MAFLDPAHALIYNFTVAFQMLILFSRFLHELPVNSLGLVRNSDPFDHTEFTLPHKIHVFFQFALSKDHLFIQADHRL